MRPIYGQLPPSRDLGGMSNVLPPTTGQLDIRRIEAVAALRALAHEVRAVNRGAAEALELLADTVESIDPMDQ